MRSRIWLSGGLLAMLLGLVAGCSGSSGANGAVARNPAAGAVPLQHSAASPNAEGSSGSGDSASTGSGSTGSGSANSGSSGSGATGSASTGSAPLTGISPAGRQVIRSATVNLVVSDVSGAANRAQQIADTAGGYVASEDAQDDSAALTLSVPQPQLDTVLGQLSALGRVTSRQQQAQDVTDQLVDVRSRIASQQASVDRVRALLGQAGSLSDVVSIEDELTKRESDLEALEQQQAELAGQVALSTVSVNLAATAPPPPVVAAAASPGFLNGLTGGWRALVGTVRVLGVVFGALLPFLIALGIPAVAGLIIWRRRRRAPAASSAPVPE